MRIVLPLEKKEYLHDLCQRMDSWFSFGESRFTGVVLGSFLYITNHAGYEWNRRITNEKSRAIGFVTRHGDGCEVKVIFTWGYLDPVSLIWMYLLMLGILQLRDPGSPVAYILAAVIALGICAISAVQCWFTQRGQQTFDDLLSLLYNPEFS